MGFCLGLNAQTGEGRIADDVYYLLPEFTGGVVYFQDRPPAPGLLNICAADNTLRFKDADGQELVADSLDEIIMVKIGPVNFIHNKDGFFRKYPVTANKGVAYQRNLRIHQGAKRGAYGTIDQTSSIKQYSSLLGDGGMYKLSNEVPYEVEEDLALYIGNTVMPFNKKSLRKMFPERTDEINAWFRSSRVMPRTVEEAQELLSQWAD